MKIILEKNKIFRLAIGAQTKKVNNCRFLKYLLFEKVDDGLLILNILTKELIHLNKLEIEDLEKNLFYDSELVKYLIQNWFLVDQNFDEEILYNQLLQIYRNLSKKDPNKYTIITTTDCNARCFYCYQYDMQKLNMSEYVANKAADYIIKNSDKYNIHISWFGGEPLFNILPIDIISKKLNEAGISFTSSTISNGYLFDNEIIKKAINLWKLKKVQITLDGTEKVYNKCKSYIYSDSNPFQRVISNINNLTNNGIKVAIRLNLGLHNCDNILELVNLLVNIFTGNQNIHIYPHLLFENVGKLPKIYTEEESQFLYQKLYQIEKVIEENALCEISPLTNKFKQNACMANDDRSYVITPNGSLAKCENIITTDLCGDIFENKIDFKKIESMSERIFFKLCDSCPLLPHCINLKICPTKKVECNYYEQNYRIRKIKQCMKITYENWLRQ